ncbi:MAG: DUF1015 domain-containing protein [Clostridia bacterium]|nr:DUF1015 domain-containing protein [Clostridia bacterium]
MNASLTQRFAACGVSIPEILLPAPGIDLSKFAVVACDQHVSDASWWEEAARFVGDAPSALNLILPEAYLEQPDREERIQKINQTMRDYLAQGVLRSVGEGFLYLHRTISTGVRHGVVLALDLECYDYTAGAKSLIRATEQTIPDRLPSRIRIRENAVLELPHILVLIDDADNLFMAPAEHALERLPLCYDFDLMQGSGNIKGWTLQEETVLEEMARALEELVRRGEGLLFAMGDGNHSLAAAKAFWEELKPTLTEEERSAHPARYALCEIVNLHDEAMVFEPIHRVLFQVDRAALEREIGVTEEKFPPLQELQPLLDQYLAAHPETKIDYTHGEQTTRRLGGLPGNMPLVLPSLDKSTFFEIVRRDGAFVRKSFSLGEAPDKRFYLEARRIRP